MDKTGDLRSRLLDYSVADLRWMLTYHHPRFTRITFAKVFGEYIPKADIEDALNIKLAEQAFLGIEDCDNKVNFKEPEYTFDVNYGNTFGT